MRITKVTTKTGDQGNTSLADGSKVSKSSLRIGCIGEIDELNSFIGFVKVAVSDLGIVQDLNKAQNDLLNMGGELSSPDKNLDLLRDKSISKLESDTEKLNQELPPLKEFLLPGGDECSARIHMARSVCRRAERKIVQLIETESGSNIWIKYLNRLSDYLFVLARYHTNKRNIDERQWEKQ